MARKGNLRQWTIVGAIALVLLLPSSAAQDAGAPHPSPDVKTLYAHAANNAEGWLNTLADDGTATNMAAGQMTDSSYTWTFVIAPALTSSLLLDTAGTIDITAYVGHGAGAASVSLSTRMVQGETVIAEAPSTSHPTTPANANEGEQYNAKQWSLTPAVDRLEAGQDVVWTVTAQGTASALFLAAGTNRGRTNMVLPITGVAESGPGVILENLTGPAVDLDFEFFNATNQSYVYNWTTDLGAVDIAAAGNVTNGSVDFRIVDGTESEAASGLFEVGMWTDERANATVNPGNWRINVTFLNFTGSFSLSVGAAVPMMEDVPPPTDNGTDDNMTEPPEEDGGGVPGFGVLATIAAAVCVLVAARRRRS